MDHNRFDVIVVGGGPAGITAATALGKRGFSVLVCEAAVYPGAENWSGAVYFTENLESEEAFGRRAIEEGPVERKLVERGFYLYGDKKKKAKGKKPVDETVYDLLPGGRKRKKIDVEQVQKRVALQMVNEAMHCLGEGILRNPRDGDIGAIFGLGFPPFMGGPFRYVDVRGAGRVLDDLKQLRDTYGERFEPAPALVQAAADNRKFRD